MGSGGVWIFSRNVNTWTQNGNKININTTNWNFTSVSISADAGTMIIGNDYDVKIFASPPNSNTSLYNIGLSSGSLSPSFIIDTMNYTSNVNFTITSLTITPRLVDENASMQIRINGGSYSNIYNGAISSSLALNVGNNIINLKVTAPDGTTTKIYTITVIRALSFNADLASLNLSQANLIPIYNNSTLAYSSVVTNATNSITDCP